MRIVALSCRRLLRRTITLLGALLIFADFQAGAANSETVKIQIDPNVPVSVVNKDVACDAMLVVELPKGFSSASSCWFLNRCLVRWHN